MTRRPVDPTDVTLLVHPTRMVFERLGLTGRRRSETRSERPRWPGPRCSVTSRGLPDSSGPDLRPRAHRHADRGGAAGLAAHRRPGVDDVAGLARRAADRDGLAGRAPAPVPRRPGWSTATSRTSRASWATRR